MEEPSSPTENPHKQVTGLAGSKRLSVWLISISILASILFLVDAVFAFAIIGASVEHFKTGSKGITTHNDISVPYAATDFNNDLEIEIPSIFVTFVFLVAGPLGGWVLRKRKPKLAFVLSLLVLVSLFTTFLLGLLLVFS